MLVGGIRRTRLSAIKEVRVIAALSELHDDIQQARFALLLARHAVDGVNVSLEKRFVPFALHGRHAYVDVDLLLWQ